MEMDQPPSPIGEDDGLGPPWPGMVDESFNLVLPGKGNSQGGKGVGFDELQYAANKDPDYKASKIQIIKC
eukprot:8420485-Karenia_brevis.AAC.1